MELANKKMQRLASNMDHSMQGLIDFVGFNLFVE
jgi:hypothetical protein